MIHVSQASENVLCELRCNVFVPEEVFCDFFSPTSFVFLTDSMIYLNKRPLKKLGLRYRCLEILMYGLLGYTPRISGSARCDPIYLF